MGVGTRVPPGLVVHFCHWTENKISVESDINRHVTGRAVTVNTLHNIWQSEFKFDY